jgi:hypothetical protein
MNKEIRSIVLRGWLQWRMWENKGVFINTGKYDKIIMKPTLKRNFLFFPHLKISFPNGIGLCLFYSEFGFLFWNGQFSILTIKNENVTN